MSEQQPKVVTAAILVIGNEILSGRTKDKNLGFLAENLTALGVQVREGRFVPDLEEEIVAAVNHCRAKYDYVFTTGGIGPTHDDITADAIAAAFGTRADYHPEAMEILTRHYQTTGMEFNEARKRMARTPLGAALVENPVSKAPGFRMENVYTMAGIPVIVEAMFASMKHELVGGDPVRSLSIMAYLGEGTIAAGLAAIQKDYPEVDIGSYPFHRDGVYGTTLVCRSALIKELNQAGEAVRQMVRELGGDPVDVEEGAA